MLLNVKNKIKRRKKKKNIQITTFKKSISSLLFGIQIFIDLYSLYIERERASFLYIYIFNMCHCKVTDKIIFAKKKRKRKIYVLNFKVVL